MGPVRSMFVADSGPVMELTPMLPYSWGSERYWNDSLLRGEACQVMRSSLSVRRVVWSAIVPKVLMGVSMWWS